VIEMLLKAQSELLSSVILVVLVLLIGLSGFLLANSWVSQRYYESAFSSFADLCLSEFQASLISMENRSSTRIVYVGVVRAGILAGDYNIGVTLYNGSDTSPMWWTLKTIDSQGFSYNLSPLYASLGNLSFVQASGSAGFGSQVLYTKFAGSWVSIRDMGYSGSITIYSIGVMRLNDVLVLNISISDPSSRYLYIVIWTRFNDRYIASPILVSLI
jgi:hypothetical protein